MVKAANVIDNTIKVHPVATPETGAERANGTEKARLGTNSQVEKT
ncbi:hypothetical protein ACIBF6_33140 [Streptosporangium amethystogenes]